MSVCQMCGIEFTPARSNAKFCSAKCRVTFSRVSVTQGKFSVTQPLEAVTFRFTIKQRPGSKPGDENWNEAKAKVREEKYWYNIPLAAVPVMQEGWPEMPEYMDGRQYFLWWKNEFDTKDGLAVIYNPYPSYDKLTYYQAGEGSRRYGA